MLIGELALRGRFHEIPERLFLRRDHPETTLRLFPTEQERYAWFEPTRKHGTHFPVLKLGKEHLGAIRRVPMSPYDRLRCRLLVIRYLSWHLPVFMQVKMNRIRRRRTIAPQARKV